MRTIWEMRRAWLDSPDVEELLEEGWEPFTITRFGDGATNIWFKRKEVKECRVREDDVVGL